MSYGVPPPAGSVPPAWYPDPTNPGLQRYWNGTAWTQHTTPLYASAPIQPVVGASPDDPVHWLLPTGRSWESIVAGYLGLFSIVIVFLGPLALAFGILGLRRAKTGGHGRGRSIFGLVAGIWGTTFTILFLILRLTGN